MMTLITYLHFNSKLVVVSLSGYYPKAFQIVAWRSASVLMVTLVTPLTRSRQCCTHGVTTLSLSQLSTAPRGGGWGEWSQHHWTEPARCGTTGRHAPSSLHADMAFSQVYEMESGQLLCSLLFDSSVSAVMADVAETWLFVGLTTGSIVQVNLYLPVSATLCQSMCTFIYFITEWIYDVNFLHYTI